MTDDPYDLNSVAAVLRAPALPSEQEGEAAAVSALIDAHALASASTRVPRSRRVSTIVAVTVASLGVGGLVAAGPRIFTPSVADAPPSATPATELLPRPVDHGRPTGSAADSAETPPGKVVLGDSGPTVGPDDVGTEEQTADLDPTDLMPPEFVDDATIGSCLSAAISEILAEVPPGPERGQVLPGRIQAAVTECTDTGVTATPDTPATNPGRSGDAPGQTGDTPGQSGGTPGQSGNTPGQSGDTPGQSRGTPGQSGNTPGQSGDTPGQTGDTPGTPEPPAAPNPNGNGNGNGKAGG